MGTTKPDFTVEELTEQLRVLGVRNGGVLLVHTSFRKVRPVSGGPIGLIRALSAAIGESGTLVMPTMTDGVGVFHPAQTPTVDMGITAETFWRLPDVIRSTHPGGSFAAKGRYAKFICQPQPLSPPHGLESPVGRVYELGGQVLLLGVSHQENTTLHLAESIAGVPYSISHPCTVRTDECVQSVMIAETDHCCKGFDRADTWMRERGLQREGKVGSADARLCESLDIVTVATDYLRAKPFVFLCPPEMNCDECDMAWASIQV